MDTQKAVNRLNALAVDALARSKTAQLRDVLPAVERAIAAGVTHAKILEALRESGLELKPKTFASSLARLRAQAGATPNGGAHSPSAAIPAEAEQSHQRLASASGSGSEPALARPAEPIARPAQTTSHPDPSRKRPSLEEVLARPPNVTELEQRARRRERLERGDPQ